ncbi:twin-arginine translocation signal domain-containing protein [Roseibium sp. TrichSKD4]|uniref:twin-arginine translocation signal domain-containing protein n=1 Tax=Roseibium sp. TrichSKD4 TaxID=744980 RepID=UPI00058DBA5B|nr:twin-arginine translocation signal domain-containing protein [Roseibium sp. TrichSKD4]
MTTRRDFMKAVPTVGAAFVVAGKIALDETPARAQSASPLEGHFHPKGKAPSENTLKRQKPTDEFSQWLEESWVSGHPLHPNDLSLCQSDARAYEHLSITA